MTQLSTEQLADLRQLLQQQQTELEQLVRGRLHVDGSEEAKLSEAADAEPADAEVDANVERLQRDIERLNEVNHALARFGQTDESAYGRCESCGEPVGYPRLLAHPAARLCLSCQTARERVARPGGAHHQH